MHRFRAILLVAVLLLVKAPPSRAAYGDITFLSNLPLSATAYICDVWGYVDPNTSKEYAIVGRWYDAIFIVDITDPYSPTLVSTVTGVPGFDHKVFGHYIYTCDGNATGHDTRIIDIANPASPVVSPNTLLSAHNISISQDGYLALEYRGLTLYDLNNTPASPDSLWRRNTNDGHDSTPHGNQLMDFHGYTDFRLWDVSNHSSPVLQSTIVDPTINYYHSGDMSQDGRYLFICDELANTPEPDIIVYDMINYASPLRVGSYGDATATVHNLYVLANMAVASYYSAGFRTFDVSNPVTPVLLDTYDTHVGSGENYDGAFGVYPYSPNNLVLVSDWDNGLYVFRVEGFTGPPTGVGDTPRAAGITLQQNYPNPFNPSTTIRFELLRDGDAALSVFDVRGLHVRTLSDGPTRRGSHEVTWDGNNDAGAAVSSGVYYYRLQVGPTSTTKKMVLLK